MAKEHMIPKGMTFTGDPDKVPNGIAMFSLERWLKKALHRIGVQFGDCCEQASPTGFSVRISADGTKLEKFDTSDMTWKDSGLI